MSFKDQPFKDRFKKLGDEAEGAWERNIGKDFRWERFGWDRTALRIGGMPAMMQNRPDYVTETTLYECMGFGRDRIFKMKHHKLSALVEWDAIMETVVFIWDGTNRRWTSIPVRTMWDLVVRMPIDHFPEGTPYAVIRPDELDWAWNDDTPS